MNDTDCRKCKAPMPPMVKSAHPLMGTFTITGYLCKRCGHWNNLKRRKPKPAKS